MESDFFAQPNVEALDSAHSVIGFGFSIGGDEVFAVFSVSWGGEELENMNIHGDVLRTYLK